MTKSVKTVWMTPNADQLMTYIARVSNPEGQEANANPGKLIRRFLQSKPPHWSPFEMVCACLEITTTRDIAHQILRHWSFRFQEFSQRYANVSLLPGVELREARLQDKTNRQHSISLPPSVAHLQGKWEGFQEGVIDAAQDAYKWALDMGIARECARVVLPEGLTPTRLYMQGSMRSWITYCMARTDKTTQKEHRIIAEEMAVIFKEAMPLTWEAAFPEK